MRIEAGKWYLNREGNCVGPMQRNPDASIFWQDGEGFLYFPDGRVSVGNVPDARDLVKEWINPDAQPRTRSNVQRHVDVPPPLPPRYAQPIAPQHPFHTTLQDVHARSSVDMPPPPVAPWHEHHQHQPVSRQEPDVSYDGLSTILRDAHAQASVGKGRERHANGRPFDRQPIMELGRMFGPGFAAGQAAKKAQEAMGMLHRQNNDAAVAELLGAINYLAACVMLVREHRA